jgi:cobalamin-dependent methionine synthase I
VYGQAPVVHVLDASRSVPVVAALVDDALRDEFVQEVKEEYAVLVFRRKTSLLDIIIIIITFVT